jgi:hypothetical protein
VVRDDRATHEHADEYEPHARDRHCEPASSRGRWNDCPARVDLALCSMTCPALPLVSVPNGGYVLSARHERGAVSKRRHQIASRLTAIPTA